ncbi:MAG: putative TIM-barrel fold metal-dependent hydrolase [Paracoccaceae bacterium]|jgi:predicted TIM-barrel fold metal-dependent hydrolase
MIEFDCHAHVYERVAAVAGARYEPGAPAPLAAWRDSLRAHGLRGGVIVQVSFLGTDNSELCAALEALDRRRFAGMAVVAPDVATAEIERLAALGVRGFRWNLVRGAPLPDLADPMVRRFLDRVFEWDMHLELHLEGPRLAPWIGSLLAVGGKVVVDHFGLPSDPEPFADPWLSRIDRLPDVSRLYVKLSARYRTGFELTAHAAYLADHLAANRLVWGSDWPHTQHESRVGHALVAADRARLAGLGDAAAVAQLYRLTPG